MNSLYKHVCVVNRGFITKYDNLARCTISVPGSTAAGRWCQHSRGGDGWFEVVPREEEKNLRVGVCEGVAGAVVMAGQREGGRDLPFLREVKRDLTVAREECVRRGLLHTTKWWVGGGAGLADLLVFSCLYFTGFEPSSCCPVPWFVCLNFA